MKSLTLSRLFLGVAKKFPRKAAKIARSCKNRKKLF